MLQYGYYQLSTPIDISQYQEILRWGDRRYIKRNSFDEAVCNYINSQIQSTRDVIHNVEGTWLCVRYPWMPYPMKPYPIIDKTGRTVPAPPEWIKNGAVQYEPIGEIRC